jgi:hypothetical protein
MSVRDHHKGVRKLRHKLPDFVRKAGPHQPVRIERKSTKRDVIRRAMQECLS